MGDRAQIWRDTQILVINYLLVTTSRMYFNTKYFRPQKRCVSMIYLCTFKNILLFISGDRFESPFNKSLREVVKYGEIAIISSLRCTS